VPVADLEVTGRLPERVPSAVAQGWRRPGDEVRAPTPDEVRAPTPDEVRALARLAFDELGRATSGIGDIHGAIAERVFAAVGQQAAVVRMAHRAIARTVFTAVGAGTSAFGRVADEALGRRAAPPQRRLSPTPLGGGALGVIDGLIGDALERELSALQEPMAVRVDGRVVPCEPEALRGAFPGATRRIVVFVHGLMGTEFPWGWFAAEDGGTYGTHLARDLGVTPIYVRYNTGRHISANGRSLAELLEGVVAAWPVEVDEVAVIGHSMGGLVARSACCHASEAGHAWARRVRHVVSLGTPHMGAPLAQAVHYLSAGLNALPETRPVAGLLRRRSSGIRDLRQGSLVDEDWQDCDPEALKAVVCKEVPLLEGATHCFVTATIMRSETHPLSRLIGDWLVLQPSASGRSRSRRIPFEAEYGMHLGPSNHLALLNHPAVYERLRSWLATPARELAADPS
jgi:pimeloyl-ACP methyl ester carboxylesterase